MQIDYGQIIYRQFSCTDWADNWKPGGHVEELFRPAGTASSLRLSGEKVHHQLPDMAYEC